MAYPSARRRLYFDCIGDGFGALYNAAGPPKQAKSLLDQVSSGIRILLNEYCVGFASRGGGAYLEVAKPIGPDLMSAVERLEDRRGDTPPRRDIQPTEASPIE